MTEKELEKIGAYLDAIIALCNNGDEKTGAIKVLATDLSNHIFTVFGSVE